VIRCFKGAYYYGRRKPKHRKKNTHDIQTHKKNEGVRQKPHTEENPPNDILTYKHDGCSAAAERERERKGNAANNSRWGGNIMLLENNHINFMAMNE
jgi:hypothetical protein